MCLVGECKAGIGVSDITDQSAEAGETVYVLECVHLVHSDVSAHRTSGDHDGQRTVSTNFLDALLNSF